jgi:hypothetical protein
MNPNDWISWLIHIADNAAIAAADQVDEIVIKASLWDKAQTLSLNMRQLDVLLLMNNG